MANAIHIEYTVCMAHARAYLSIIGHIAARELAIHTHSATQELRGTERGDGYKRFVFPLGQEMRKHSCLLIHGTVFHLSFPVS